MALIESFEDIPGRSPPRSIGPQPEAVVVSLIGEHDSSTVTLLSATLARAIAQDDADLVVDLTGVGFMDGSTVRVLLRAQGFLARRGRSLTLRAPRSSARLALHASGVEALIEPDPHPPAALASWVDVPLRDAPDPPLRYCEGA